MIATYYRGRTTFKELMEMPISDIIILYDLAMRQNKKDDDNGESGQRQLAELIEDEMG